MYNKYIVTEKIINTAIVSVSSMLLLLSCINKEKGSSKADKIKTLITAPRIVLLDTCPPPKKTELKNAPPPLVTVVPKTSSDSYKGRTRKGENKVELLPPAVVNASMPVAHFTNFNTQDGLALPGIMCALTDKAGRLWFGTNGGGVSCYDGTGFTNFNVNQGLAQVAVYCIAEDKNGHLWFGTYGGGVSRYDGTRFINYTTKDGLAGNDVYRMACDKKGNLWFVIADRGLSVYDGTKFTTIDTSDGLPSNFASGVAEDSKGNIWIFMAGSGICRYGGKKFEHFTTKDGLPTNYMSCFFEDSKGNLWFGSIENGVCRYDGKKFTTISTGNNPAANTVNAIAEDKDGNLWFATGGGGVIRYNGKGFVTFTTEHGLANNAVMSITKDQHGNLWFGTFGGGLSRYNGKALNTFTSKEGLPENYIRAIAEDKAGNLWFGTNGDGLICFDGKDFTGFTKAQGLPLSVVSCIVLDKNNNLWFGAGGAGIVRFDGNSLTTFTTEQGLANDQVINMTMDKDENLWIGTFGGVSRFNGKAFETYTTAQGLAENFITCITQDMHGNIWFGTGSSGVSRFDGRKFTNFSIEQGLANNSIVDIKEDRSGNLWVGSQGGVSRFDGSGFTSFNASHGLPEDYVCNIAEDEQGVLWLGTYQGFCSLNFKIPAHGQEPGEIKGAGLFTVSNEQLGTYEPVCDVYNEKTGYPIKDMIDGSLIIKKRAFPKGNNNETGIIWAPCGDAKVIRFDTKALVKNVEPPDVFIRSVKINEQAQNWYGLGKIKSDSILIAQQEATVFGISLSAKIRDSLKNKFGNIQFDSITPFYQLPLNLVLPYNHNRVSFDFGAIETNRNFMVRYQYMLEGYDDTWNPVTEKRTASYGNIAEGTYTFKLKAQSPEGIWSAPLAYSFTVLPPWYRTWWAYCLYALFFTATLWRFIKWRLSVLKKEKIRLEEKLTLQNAVMTERLRISRELHDEVGATLSGIAMYSHLTKEQIKKVQTAEVEKSLTIMQQSAGDMVNKLNDIVWLVNPEQDSLQKLIQRLEEYAGEMAMIKNMQVKVIVPDNIHTINLPVEHRRNIYLFCKEAINNAVKYSNASLLELTIKEIDDKLEFAVTDNGKGFDTTIVKRGNGLDNMQKRADEIGALLALHTKQNKGTSVSLQCPV
ncbi:hypothetical protein BH10BAC2_BH10BAC2_40810 [soil metagenome]